MKITSSSNSVQQWFKSLPITKISNQSQEGEVVKFSENRKFESYQISPTDFLSEREYTVTDAIKNQGAIYASISIEDIINGTVDHEKTREYNKLLSAISEGKPLPETIVNKVKNFAIENKEYNHFQTTAYFNGVNTMGINENGDLSQSIDYLATGYAVSKKHIVESFIGDEKQQQLTDLETMFQSEIVKIADKLSKEMGGFFEENGVEGETKKIYKSIMEAYQNEVDRYSKYLEKNHDYAKLNNTENEWLKNDIAYMASELRKVVKSEDVKSAHTENEEYYSIGDLKQTNILINEIKKYDVDSRSDRGLSYSLSTDEEIGFKFAELAIKGKIFRKNTDVADELKNSITNAMDQFMTNALEKLNKKEMNKEIINSTYDHIMSIYEKTGDASRTLKEGSSYAREAHETRTEGGDLYRDAANVFWGNFNQVSSNYNEYFKESGIEKTINSWNDFVKQLTEDNELSISTTDFSAYV